MPFCFARAIAGFMVDALLGKSRIVPKKRVRMPRENAFHCCCCRRNARARTKRKNGLRFFFFRARRRRQWGRRFFFFGSATRHPGFIEDAVLGKNVRQREKKEKRAPFLFVWRECMACAMAQQEKKTQTPFRFSPALAVGDDNKAVGFSPESCVMHSGMYGGCGFRKKIRLKKKDHKRKKRS